MIRRQIFIYRMLFKLWRKRRDQELARFDNLTDNGLLDRFN